MSFTVFVIVNTGAALDELEDEELTEELELLELDEELEEDELVLELELVELLEELREEDELELLEFDDELLELDDDELELLLEELDEELLLEDELDEAGRIVTITSSVSPFGSSFDRILTTFRKVPVAPTLTATV